MYVPLFMLKLSVVKGKYFHCEDKNLKLSRTARAPFVCPIIPASFNEAPVHFAANNFHKFPHVESLGIWNIPSG